MINKGPHRLRRPPVVLTLNVAECPSADFATTHPLCPKSRHGYAYRYRGAEGAARCGVGTPCDLRHGAEGPTWQRGFFNGKDPAPTLLTCNYNTHAYVYIFGLHIFLAAAILLSTLFVHNCTVVARGRPGCLLDHRASPGGSI